MTPEHKVIIVPGLNGDTNNIYRLTRKWPEKYGLNPVMASIDWKDGEDFEPKLRRLTSLIDRFADQGDTISLVGCSAGGSGVMNAFVERKDVITCVVNNGGFLRPGTAKGLRSFEQRTAFSPAFGESILRFSELEPTLTPEDREKILTVRPLFDELVPPETVVISGAMNTTVPMLGHVLGLALALVKYDPVIKFLRGN